MESKNFRFYEFGSTIFEKIYYFKLIDKILKRNISKKIEYIGTEPSKKMNFFSKNFHKLNKIKVYENFNKKINVKSSFYSKGVTLLYKKNNYQIIKSVISNFDSGSFDFSILKNDKKYKINTGKKLFYIAGDKFINLFKNSKKIFLIRNQRKTHNKIYFEIVFGNKIIIKNFLKKYDKFKDNPKLKFFGTHNNFEELDLNKHLLF